MLIKPCRIIAFCLLSIACNMAHAACSEPEVRKDILERLTWGYDDANSKAEMVRYVVDIVKPEGDCLAYLAFKEMSEPFPWGGSVAKETNFELYEPGTAQMGLHLVELNRVYLVVESATAIGWFISEIYIIQNGKPTLFKTLSSGVPPIFTSLGKQDYVQVVTPARKKKRIPLLRRE
jgi:hypothetical protein